MMVDVSIDYRIVIAGIIALTIICVTLILYKDDSTVTITAIVGAIALGIGFVIPAPKIDNSKGTIKLVMGC